MIAEQIRRPHCVPLRDLRLGCSGQDVEPFVEKGTEFVGRNFEGSLRGGCERECLRTFTRPDPSQVDSKAHLGIGVNETGVGELSPIRQLRYRQNTFHPRKLLQRDQTRSLIKIEESRICDDAHLLAPPLRIEVVAFDHATTRAQAKSCAKKSCPSHTVSK